MTSREKTGYLPHPEPLDRAIRKKTLADWAMVAFFGAISWPWLLRSLSGGSKDDRVALLERLKLSPDALPNLGSWKADAKFLHLIVDQIFDIAPMTVVEFGVGATSVVAARALHLMGVGRLIGYDEHKDFVRATREWLRELDLKAETRHAPLTRIPKDWRGRWYDYYGLPERIDLLILDGPHWAVHPYVRGAADEIFDRVPVGGVVLLDDAARPGERVIAKRWRKRWPEFEFRYVNGGAKGTLVGVRRRESTGDADA